MTDMNLELVRTLNLAALDHLQDIGATASVMQDTPPVPGEHVLVVMCAIVNAEESGALIEAIARLLNELSNVEETAILFDADFEPASTTEH